MGIVKVAIDCPVDALFDYRVAGTMPPVGGFVVVPFGRRRAVGLVLEHAQRAEVADHRLREVERILAVPSLPEDVLALMRFAAEYYQCPIGQAAFAGLPTRLGHAREADVKAQWAYELTSAGRALAHDHFPARAALKRRLLEAFRAKPALGRQELAEVSARAPALAEAWIGEGWVARREKPVAELERKAALQSVPSPALPTLTDEQRAAVDAIAASLGTFSAWLLEGVTGSGKTEVYFRLIEQVAASGGQSLLMVPEINLTPQLESRLRERFPALQLASLHSNLAEGERMVNWLAARQGKAGVVIGTRLSVFTPMPRLGLVVVDEEQDASFKQKEGLRYSARDLAIFLARLRGVPVVLGSATPSLETYHNARSGKYGHLHLVRRPAAGRPDIRLLDLRGRARQAGVCDEALVAIEARLARSEQSLVFLNRRGFAPALACGACGWSAACDRCNARLVWHLADAILRCHYCGHEEALPRRCPDCGNQDLKGLGQGTQRIEQSLSQRFAGARILRIDRDSTRRKHAWRAMQDDIRAERVDILVGTQMLAKGHDFPKLTLVVVVNADAALFSVDFRAAERLFQQLMQVAGRAGRDRLPGEVLVQTQFPEHPLYRALVRQDYRGFADELLAERASAGFPPFLHQAILRAESRSEADVMGFLAHAASLSGPGEADVVLYDPVPASVSKVAGHHRGHLLAQSASRAAMQRFLSRWRAALAQRKIARVRWSLDVDPLEL